MRLSLSFPVDALLTVPTATVFSLRATRLVRKRKCTSPSPPMAAIAPFPSFPVATSPPPSTIQPPSPSRSESRFVSPLPPRDGGMDADGFFSLLLSLDRQIPPNETALLLLDDPHHFLHQITPLGRGCEVRLAPDAPPRCLPHLRIHPLPTPLFLRFSPLSPAISPIRAKFKSSLVRAVASRAQNRRGYKRILSPAEVATILQETCCDIPAGNPDEWVEEALREFRDSFSVAGELCLDAEAFQRLEWVPFLAGVGVIRDYLRDEAFQPLLFGNPGFPECPFAPPAGEFINQRQERETQEVETDLVPTTTMAKEFVEKLEGIVDAHAELQMQREVYMSLIRRVKSHFDCLGVCWR